jgi:hypothetical protein
VASSDYEQPTSTNNILAKMWPILSAFVANRLKRAVELRLKKHQPATVRTPREKNAWVQRDGWSGTLVTSHTMCVCCP